MTTSNEDGRRGREAALQDNEARAFLLALSDGLRPIADPVAIQEFAARLLGERLGASRVIYGEIIDETDCIIHPDYVNGVPSIAGRVRLADFGEEVIAAHRRHEAYVVDDAETDPRVPEAARASFRHVRVRANATVGLVKNGRWVAAFGAHDVNPRRWTPIEIALIEETAERTWAAVERARAEMALRESEEKYRSLFESIDEGFALCELVRDQAGKPVDYLIREMNPAGERILQLENAAGRRRSSLLWGFSDMSLELYARLVASNEPLRLERYNPDLDRYFSVLALPRGGDRFAVLFADITARKRADAALRENAELMRLAAAAARLYGWEVDLVKGRLRVSAEAHEVTGLDFSGDFREAMKTFHPADVERVQAEFATAVTRGGDFEIEYRHDGDGPQRGRWFRAVGTVIQDATGTPLRALGVTHEITTHKASEAALRDGELRARTLLAQATAARTEAEAANRAKDEFLATLSHELRTPLAAILLWAAALRSGAVPISELGIAIAAIAESAESQSRLIDDLLDLSRLTSGKFLLQPSPVAVEAVARAAVDVVRPMADAKGIAVHADIAPDLDLAILDGARFKQVLWNLLSNATKFTPKGGDVTLRVRRDDDDLVVEVADTGEGITPEFMPHVFERFRQADMAETRAHAGLGIGLALSRQLVSLHGGTIEVHSDGPGRGALFRVRIPWLKPSVDAPAGADGASDAELSSRLDGVRVLLVEDDTNTRDAMRWMLDRAGAAVIPVASAAEALSVLGVFEPPAGDAPAEIASSRGTPDVIVSDLGLPGMSGYELIERVVEHFRERGRPSPPACAVSAHAREVDRRRAIDAGFDLYVAKPVTPERLLDVVVDLRDIATAHGA